MCDLKVMREKRTDAAAAVGWWQFLTFSGAGAGGRGAGFRGIKRTITVCHWEVHLHWLNHSSRQYQQIYLLYTLLVSLVASPHYNQLTYNRLFSGSTERSICLLLVTNITRVPNKERTPTNTC